MNEAAITTTVSYILDQGLQGVTLKDLAQFITGSATVPPLGLPCSIKVEFKHDCKSECKCRPTASTCTLTLVLPCHANTFEGMQELLYSAMKDCFGFGLV